MKKSTFVRFTGCLLVLFAGGRVAKSPNGMNATAAQFQEESKEPRETSETAQDPRKAEYRKQIENKLAEFNDRFEALKAKGEKAGAQVKAELQKAATELEKKMVAAKQQLEKFKSASVGAWEKAKSEMDAVIKDLETFYERTVDRFKKTNSKT